MNGACGHNADTRVELCRLANEAGLASHRNGAPTLTPDAPRETLIDWLSWNDPNGNYRDEQLARENEDPLTLDDAWESIHEALP